MLYPSTASWWSKYHQSAAIRGYDAEVTEDTPPGAAVQLERAHRYNRALALGDITIGGGYNKPTTSAYAPSDDATHETDLEAAGDEYKSPDMTAWSTGKCFAPPPDPWPVYEFPVLT